MKYAPSNSLNVDGPAPVDARQWWDMENQMHKGGYIRYG